MFETVSNMLLNSVYNPKSAEITPVACWVLSVSDLQIAELWVLLLTKLSLPVNSPGWGLCWLDKLELICGIKPSFPVGITKAADPPFSFV